MADQRECCKCIYCQRDRGSNSGWYCDYKRTHVRPGKEDRCGNYESKYRD